MGNIPPQNIVHWRRWVLLMVMHEQDGGATKTLTQRVRRRGWRLFPQLPLGTAEAQLMSDNTLMYRALRKCEEHGQVQSIPHASGQRYWTITPIGRTLVKEHLINNPHITKAKLESLWS